MSTWLKADPADVPAAVAAAYRLDVQALERLDRESVNLVYRATCGNRQVILKRLARATTDRWLAFQSATLTALAADGAAVSAPVPTAEGAPFVREGDATWQVWALVEGSPYRRESPAHVDEAASFLDRLHAAPAPGGPAAADLPATEAEQWARADESAFDDLASLITEVPGIEPGPLLAAYRDAWERAAPLIRSEYARSTPCLSHGEYIGSNLLFSGDRLAAVIDWDAVGVRPRVADLARGALFLARTKRGGITIEPQVAVTFLTRATATRPLREAELDLIIPYLELFFIPEPAYLRLLRASEPALLHWYLDWSGTGARTVRSIMLPVVESLAVPA